MPDFPVAVHRKCSMRVRSLSAELVQAGRAGVN
jgi:hypothetical protein